MHAEESGLRHRRASSSVLLARGTKSAYLLFFLVVRALSHDVTPRVARQDSQRALKITARMGRAACQTGKEESTSCGRLEVIRTAHLTTWRAERRESRCGGEVRRHALRIRTWWGSVRAGVRCVNMAGTIALVGCACGVTVGIGSLCKHRENYQLMSGGVARSHGNTYHHFRWPIRTHRCLFLLKNDL